MKKLPVFISCNGIKLLLILLIFSTLTKSVNGQVDSVQNLNDSATGKAVSLKTLILPGALLTTGTLLNLGDLKETIQQDFPGTNTHAEEYLQYVPVAELYAADLAGIKARNTVFDQTKYLFISELFTAAIVHFLKPAANVTRPDGTAHSFPSGHTSQSFASATVLYREFNKTAPFVAYSGYLFSTTTGILRITNNRHWLPDVLAGAGIGMVVTNLVYHFQPLKNWQPFHTKQTTFYPSIDYMNGTAGIVMIF
ncbi:MAG TPA: phosphatase PAP2 family protein [Bacteroidales bacterium]|nr:phosphatase PAP2 family protein [Bacteroidales bacterium]